MTVRLESEWRVTAKRTMESLAEVEEGARRPLPGIPDTRDGIPEDRGVSEDSCVL